MIGFQKVGVIAALVSLVAGSAAVAQQDPPKAETKPADKAKEGLPLSISYKDGIWFKADEGAFQAVINGRIIANYRSVLDRPDDVPATAGANRTQPDTFLLRQARLDLQGTAFKQVEFKLQLDFPTGTQSNTGTAPSSTTGTIQDAFLGWRPSSDFGVRLGQFKEPFSQEQTTTLRATDFVERTILDRLVPARDLGVAVHGKPFSGILEYELGVFNGATRGIVDNNDEKDIAGRLRISPFKTTDVSFLKGLRLGVAATHGDVDSASIDGLDVTTTELGVKFLDAGGAANVIDGTRGRLGAELSWIFEFIGLRAEWARRVDHVQTAAGRSRIPADAYYLSATVLLTGEQKVLEDRIVPTHPIDVEGGWGAFELAARIAALRVDDDIFDLGIAAPGSNANAVRTASIGLNWYLTRNFRISPDFVLERYNREVQFGGGPRENSIKGILVRFQVDF